MPLVLVTGAAETPQIFGCGRREPLQQTWRERRGTPPRPRI
jgi:hypothetical protein